MGMDAQANLATSTVATAPSPAASGTSLTVASGSGLYFPAPPFNATIVAAGAAATRVNAEIVRVTAVSTDTLTVVRAQEGTSVRSITAGDIISASITKRTWDDARDQHGMDARTAGADATGTATSTTANNTAWSSLLASAKTSVTALPLSVSVDTHGTKTIRIPAGIYIFTTAAAFLGQENMATATSGLHFEGEPGATHIIFKPSSGADLMAFDYWWNVSFSGISFYAATTGCTLIHPTANHISQRFRFDKCTFYNWKYIGYLEGANNNSEWMFFNCHNNKMTADGAWLRIPSTGSDQFLNYWWYGCTHWGTSAPIVDSDKGGHFKVYGMDVSGWGSALTSTNYLFKVKGNSHNLGVCSLEVNGLRSEFMSNYAGLLYSEWPHGNIGFSKIDLSSQSYSGTGYTYGDIIKIVYGNVAGPQYTFRDSYLVGGVNVGWGVVAGNLQHRILFENCDWAQRTAPDTVVTYDSSGSSGNVLTYPPVEFRGCRPDTQVSPTAGQAVWDATIGFQGDLVQSLSPRVLSVRGFYGTPAGSTTPKVRLPIGALITGFEALSPSGAVTEADGGAWTLATTDATPVTIATATVSGAMSSGYDVNTALTVPFRCSTTAKATVTITPSNVAQDNPYALLLIKGYW